jgi:hypothetical protein
MSIGKIKEINHILGGYRYEENIERKKRWWS